MKLIQNLYFIVLHSLVVSACTVTDGDFGNEDSAFVNAIARRLYSSDTEDKQIDNLAKRALNHQQQHQQQPQQQQPQFMDEREADVKENETVPMQYLAATTQEKQKDFMHSYYLYILAGICIGVLIAVIVGTYCIYVKEGKKYSKNAPYPLAPYDYKTMHQYPEKQNYGGLYPAPATDHSLATSAQLYHYQDVKARQIALEAQQLQDEPLTGTYTDDIHEMYETPGFAPMSDLMVENPHFTEEATPTTTPEPTDTPRSGTPGTPRTATSPLTELIPNGEDKEEEKRSNRSQKDRKSNRSGRRHRSTPDSGMNGPIINQHVDEDDPRSQRRRSSRRRRRENNDSGVENTNGTSSNSGDASPEDPDANNNIR
jgi:hypothetical protein